MQEQYTNLSRETALLCSALLSPRRRALGRRRELGRVTAAQRPAATEPARESTARAWLTDGLTVCCCSQSRAQAQLTNPDRPCPPAVLETPQEGRREAGLTDGLTDKTRPLHPPKAAAAAAAAASSFVNNYRAAAPSAPVAAGWDRAPRFEGR